MSCTICGFWSTLPMQCVQTACMACGVVQCHKNGLARGCCKYCRYGRLPSWSFMGHPSTCMYKGCTEPAVYAYLPGGKHDCCKAHGLAVLARGDERAQQAEAKRLRRY